MDLSFDNKEKIGGGEAVKGRAKELRGNIGVAVRSKSFALDPRQHPRYPSPRKTNAFVKVKSFTMLYGCDNINVVGINFVARVDCVIIGLGNVISYIVMAVI